MAEDYDNAVKILISFGLDDAAARQAVERMDELKGSAGETTVATDKLSDSTSSLGEQAGNTGAAIQGLEISGRGLRTVFNTLGRVTFPGLGRAMSAIRFGPIVAMAVAAGAALMYFKGKLKEVNEELDKLNAKELAEHEGNVSKIKEAWDNARQEIIKYKQAVKDAGEDKDPAATRLKLIQEVSKAQTEANIKELEERQKIYIEWLKVNGGTAAQIASAEQAGKDTVNAVRDASANRSVKQIQDDIEGRKNRQSDFDDAVTGGTFKATNAGNALDFATGDRNRLREGADSLAKDAQKKQDALDKLLGDRAAAGEWAPETPEIKASRDEQEKKPREELERANSYVTQSQARIAELEKQIPILEAEKIQADAALSRAKSAGVGNSSRITQEEGEVKSQMAMEGVHEKSEKVIAALDKVSAAMELIKGKDQNQIINSGVAAFADEKAMSDAGYSDARVNREYAKAQRDSQTPGMFSKEDEAAVARYKRVAADKNAVTELSALLDTLGGNAKQMIDIMKDHQRGTISQGTEILKLQATNTSIQNQLKAIAAGNGSSPH